MSFKSIDITNVSDIESFVRRGVTLSEENASLYSKQESKIENNHNSKERKIKYLENSIFVGIVITMISILYSLHN